MHIFIIWFSQKKPNLVETQLKLIILFIVETNKYSKEKNSKIPIIILYLIVVCLAEDNVSISTDPVLMKTSTMDILIDYESLMTGIAIRLKIYIVSIIITNH